jgi:DNA (cytosine-5)-methyltransferase 1
MAVARKRTRRSLSPVPDSDDERPRPPPPAPRRSCHVPAEHEFPEGPDLQVIGETDPLDNGNDVPVRVLTDFSIYDHSTLELVPIAGLLELSHNPTLSFSAAGCVKAWIDSDDDDDDDDDEEDNDQDDAEQVRENSDDDPAAEDRIQRLKLTPIKRLSIHDLKKCHRRLDRCPFLSLFIFRLIPHSNIYILTQYAWYILDIPSPLYKPFHTSFWLKHRVLHLVVSSAISRPRLSYDDFIRSLDVSSASDDDVAVSQKILGRSITKDDVESDDVVCIFHHVLAFLTSPPQKSYLLAMLDDLQANENINIRRTPLFRALFGHQISYEFEPETSSYRSRPQSRITTGDPELQVLEHRNQTVVTTVVARVSNLLFEQNIKLANIPAQDDVDIDPPQPGPSLVHLANPNSVKWGLPTEHLGYYQSVCVDSVVYSVRLSVPSRPLWFILLLDWRYRHGRAWHR